MTEDKRLENDNPEDPSSLKPETPPEPRVTPPGQLLKQAREAARLSEQDVARELRMTVSKVRHLEADAYEKLHSDTFVRGYLRTYAKVLDMDPAEILEAYTSFRRASGWDEEEDESPIQASVPETAKPVWRFAIWIIVLLVGLWALSVWFMGNRQEPADSARVDPVEEVTQQASASEGEPGSEQEVIAAQEVGNEAGAETQEEGLSEEASATENSELSNGEAEVNPNVEALAVTDTPGQAVYGDPELLDQLRLEFSDECWVEVVDARGDVLQADLLQAGRVLTLSGEAPFNVRLGNGSAVSVQLNGEPYSFDMPAQGRLVALTVE